VNIVVVGAGAVGSVIATDLARAGDEVTLLVRPDAVPETGRVKTQVEEADREVRWAILPAAGAIAEPPDLVILCVKAPDLAAATHPLAGHIGDAPMLALHAAPEGDAVVQSALGRPIFGGIFTGGAEYLAPGMARVVAPALALDPAAPPPPEALAALRRALPVTLDAPLADLRWAHVLLSLPQALSALVDSSLAQLVDDRYVAGLSATLLTEAARVFAKAGVTPAAMPGVEMSKLRRLHAMPGLFAGRVARQELHALAARAPLADPLLQSLRRRRPTEIDALPGTIARLGRQHAVPTPITDRLIETIHRVEGAGAFLPLDTLRQTMGRP
jgi:2-dehydropantoate 2-reductase